MTVQQDESFKIGCPSYGKPTPRLVWYHDEGNFIIKGTDGDYLRTSLKVSQNITCAVENSVGKDQFTFFINVLRLPEVYITPNEERVRSRIGESVMLTCTAVGNPLPELNWVLSDGGLSNLRRYEKNLEQPLLLCSKINIFSNCFTSNSKNFRNPRRPDRNHSSIKTRNH